MKIVSINIPDNKRYPIKFPPTAEIMDVQMHRTQMVLWYRFDEEDESEPVYRFIWRFFTDEKMPKGDFKFISTVQANADTLVFHVFETR